MLGHGEPGGLAGRSQGRVEDAAHPDDQADDALVVKTVPGSGRTERARVARLI